MKPVQLQKIGRYTLFHKCCLFKFISHLFLCVTIRCDGCLSMSFTCHRYQRHLQKQYQIEYQFDHTEIIVLFSNLETIAYQ